MFRDISCEYHMMKYSVFFFFWFFFLVFSANSVSTVNTQSRDTRKMGYKNEKKPKTTIPRSKCFVRVGSSIYPSDHHDYLTSLSIKKQKLPDQKHQDTSVKCDKSNNLNSTCLNKQPKNHMKGSFKSAQKIQHIIENHNFPKHVQFTFPSKYSNLIRSHFSNNEKTSYFYRIECTLGDILLAPGFMSNYIKSNSCLVITETQLDHEDVYAISNGCLHLSLQRDTFKRAGLSNVKFTKPDSRGLGSSSYRIKYDLRSPTLVTGNPTYDRLKWALQNTLIDEEKDVHTFAISTLNQQGMPIEMKNDLAIYFHNLAKKRGVLFEAYDLIPEIYERNKRAVPDMKIPDLTFGAVDFTIDRPQLNGSINIGNNTQSHDSPEISNQHETDEKSTSTPMVFAKETAREIIQEWALNINDWLALISLDSDRSLFNDTIDSHLSSYELLDKDEESQDITVIEYSGGLISPAYIYKLWSVFVNVLNDQNTQTSLQQESDNEKEQPSSSKMNENTSFQKSWIALSVKGVEDAPVSWEERQHVYTPNGGENHYTLVKLPNGNRKTRTNTIKTSQQYQNVQAALGVEKIINLPNDDKSGVSAKRKEMPNDNTTIEKAIYPYFLLQFLDANDP